MAAVRNGKRTSPHRIAQALFCRGLPVDIEQIRAANLAFLASVRMGVAGKLRDAGGESFDAAESIAGAMVRQGKRSGMGRYMLRRAKGRGESPESIVQSALTVLAMALLGEETDAFLESTGDSSAFDEFIALTGMIGLAEDRFGNAGPIVPTREQLASEVSSIFNLTRSMSLKM